MDRVKEDNELELHKLSSELKQSKITIDGFKSELDNLNKKLDESDVYLKQEVVKSQKLKEESIQMKEKISSLETKLKTASSGQNEGTLNTGGKDKTLHNPLKSSINNSKNNSQVDVTAGLKRAASKDETEVHSDCLKKINMLEKAIDIIEKEKVTLEQKLSSIEPSFNRKEAEAIELRKSVEEKADLNSHLQSENLKQNQTIKVLKEKRDLGLKEIKKLRDKIESMKNQQALSESLNTSFSMSALNDSINLSQRDKTQVSDLLSSYSHMI